MPVNGLSFKTNLPQNQMFPESHSVSKVQYSPQNQPQKQSGLYSKEGYLETLKTWQFMFAFLAAFGIMESINKFQLLKMNLPKDELVKIAKKHMGISALGGIAAGFLTVLFAKFTNQYTVPLQEKAYDWARKEREKSEEAERKQDFDNALTEINGSKISG